MKKRISLFLIAILLFCLCIPAGADHVTPNKSELDQALIVHHAFDGTTKEEWTADTATGGKSKEVLTAVGTTVDGMTSVSGTATTLAYLGGGTNATAKGQDFVGNTTGAFTFYLSFRLNATDAANIGSGFCDTFMLNSTKDIRIFTSGLNATTKSADIYFMTSENGGCSTAVKIGSMPIGVGEEKTAFVRVALTMKYDTAAGAWSYAALLSADGGNTWTETVKNGCTGTADFFLSTSAGNRWMKLGNQNAKRVNTAQDFDDFRIYNKVLSADELKAHLGVTGAVFHGVQSTAVSETGTYGVRFIGSIDSLDYSRVGFRVTAEDGEKVWDIPSSTVYDTLLGSTEDGIVSYSAAALRGEGCYLFALTVRNIPARTDAGNDRTITFTVTPYTVSSDGVRTEGRTYSVVFSAGVFQPA